MFIHRVRNPWYRFKLLYESASQEDKLNLARDAFLFVISNKNAFSFQKKRVLEEIAKAYPDIEDAVSDEQMLDSFKLLVQETARRGEILTPAELHWVNRFVRKQEVRVAIEKMIYEILLSASSHWDKLRIETEWRITKRDKLSLAKKVLQSQIGSKRKMELAMEFGEPKNYFIRSYFTKLLIDRHYDQAEKLQEKNPEIIFDCDIMDAIMTNVENGYFRDALDIAQRFVPHRDDAIGELRQIMAAFSG